MPSYFPIRSSIVVIVTIALLISGATHAQDQGVPGAGFVAVTGLKGGQDIFGPYDVVENWPKPMAESLPELDGWTYSGTTDVFAESADRVFVLQKGILPIIRRGVTKWLPEFGPSIKFPIFRLPLRQAGFSSPRGDQLEADNVGRPGIDWRWEHSMLVLNRDGKIVEADAWEKWHHLWVRPHDVAISPYDPDKHVWVVDAEGQAVYKFTNDGSELVLTLGTPGEPGADETHLNQPTFLAFMDANTVYLADGYVNTRVIKFDVNGKFLGQWGERGQPPIETRPGYFNNVHGIAVDPVTRRVFVNDRANARVQVFDENGKFLDQWRFGPPAVVDIHSFIIGEDRKLWAADQGTHKILGYDLDGNFLYSWGSWGEFPGGMWGVHGIATDEEGNFYTASVNNGRVQKFTPRANANPEFMVGKPWGTTSQ